MIKYARQSGLALIPALIASIAGGLAQTLSWPHFSYWPLCLVCLTPLILAVRHQSARRAFFLGWVYGLTLSLSSIFWLSDVLSGYGGLGPGLGWLILLLLASFLALYHGFFGWLTSLLPLGFGGALLGAVFLCGLDWLKNWVFTGFNWTPLAGPLALSPIFSQAGDILGFYGLGLAVALINFLVAGLISRPQKGLMGTMPTLAAILILVSAAYFYGRTEEAKWDRISADSPTLKAAVLQPSVPQDHKWNQNFRDEILQRYELLLAKAWENAPDLILWPETALPFVFGEDGHETSWLFKLAQKTQAPMLVGLTALSGRWPATENRNRAWLFTKGEPSHFYDKEHLVPFGEYVPLDWLPFLKWTFMQGLIGAAGAYSPGARHQPLIEIPLSTPGHLLPLGCLICFESTFPYLAQDRVMDGAKILTVTTNDAWFGHSPAPTQHLYQAAMRAIETRRPLLRAGNNGISALIGPSGRITAPTSLDQIGAFIYEIPMLADPPLTPFVRWGYLLSPLAAAFTVLSIPVAFLISRTRSSRKRR